MPASTSPPITILTSPKPVLTMEQNCASLLTISLSRFSISSREQSSQLVGSVERVSNL